MGTDPIMTALLGLDIGTTNCKLVAYSETGEVIVKASKRYEILYPQRGHAELNSSEVVDAVINVFKTVSSQISNYNNLLLSISTQGEAFVLVDRHGDVLTAAPISIDTRGLNNIEDFIKLEEVKSACNEAKQSLNSTTSLAKLLWFEKNLPELLANTAYVLSLGEYVLMKFGLKPKIDFSMASRMGLLNNTRLEWSKDLMDYANLSESLFSPVACAGKKVGTVNIDITKKLGLKFPISVFLGGHDQACAALGAGLNKPHTALYSIGTTEAIAITFDRISSNLHRKSKLSLYPHVIQGQYLALMGNQSGGRLLDWFKKLRGIENTKELFANLPSYPSKELVLSHFSGTGSILANESAYGCFSSLSFETSPEELTHAVLEGITFEQAIALQHAKKYGVIIKKLRAAGGGTQSPAWMQIKADIMGIPLECTTEKEASCAGAAILAGVGGGVFSSINEAVCKFTKLGEIYQPRPKYHQIYIKKLELYYDQYISNLQHQVKQEKLFKMIQDLKRARGSQ